MTEYAVMITTELYNFDYQAHKPIKETPDSIGRGPCKYKSEYFIFEANNDLEAKIKVNDYIESLKKEDRFSHEYYFRKIVKTKKVKS